jgi:Outer membrane protein beta-barrel domain
MKFSNIRKLLATLALCGCSTAFAQSALGNFYIEAGYSSMGLALPTSANSSPKMHRLVLGMNLHPNLAAEEILGFNAQTDRITRSGVAGFVKVKTVTGIYLKPKVNLADDKLTVFARIGYANYQTDFSTSPHVASGGGSSFGLGVSYKLTDSFFVNLDRMSYFNRNGIEIKGTTCGVGYAF